MSYVPASGPIPCSLMLVGEAPGYEEVLEGRPFVGKSGKELWAAMERFVGLTRADFYVTNLVKTRLPNNRDPNGAEISAALPDFLGELDAVHPRTIVTAGAFATRCFIADRPLSDIHGIPHAVEYAGGSYVVVPTYHPAAGLHSKSFLAAFAFDLRRLRAYLDGRLGTWAGVGGFRQVYWGAPTKRRGDVVAVDTEGWPEKPWGLSCTDDGEAAYVVRADDDSGLRNWRRWLGDRPVAGHNILHDIPVLRAMSIHLTETPYIDTQALVYHHAMRTGSGVLEAESQNLGTAAYRFCGMELGELRDCKGVDLEQQIIPYTDEVRDYAGPDALATWRLAHCQDLKPLIESRPFQIDMGQIDLVEQMVASGLPIDEDVAKEYYTDVVGYLADARRFLRAEARLRGQRDFNPGSHPQVRALLATEGIRPRKRTKGGLSSTSEKALVEYASDPLVAQLQKFRELQKLKGTYVEPLLESLV